MTVRTTILTVVFQFPFDIPGVGGLQPAGEYLVETDEELLGELSFPAYRQVRTIIRIPRGFGQTSLVEIELKDLRAALAREDLRAASVRQHEKPAFSPSPSTPA